VVDGGTRRAECCLYCQVEAVYGKEEGKPSFDFVPSLGFQHNAGIEAGFERDLIRVETSTFFLFRPCRMPSCLHLHELSIPLLRGNVFWPLFTREEGEEGG